MTEVSKAVLLASAVMSLAGRLDPELELAPKDENEDPIDHSLRLIEAISGAPDRIDELEAENEKLKTAKTAAQKKAKAAEAAAPDKARKVGPMNFPNGAPRPAELRKLLAEAETVEIVLSDGKSEIPGLAPRSVTGDAWQDAVGGLKLNVPELQVHGPGLGSSQRSFAVLGYGLLIDGKQVAWSQRPEQLTIAAGQTVELKDDVIF